MQALEAVTLQLRRVQRRAVDDAAQLGFHRRLTEMMRAGENPETIMTSVVHEVGDHLGVARCLIGLSEESAMGAALHQWTAADVATIPEDIELPQSLTALAMERAGDDRGLWIEDIRNDPRVDPAAAEETVRTLDCVSFGAVPVWAGTELLGWLALHSVEPHRWTAAECGLVSAVSTDLSASLLQHLHAELKARTEQTLRDVDALKRSVVTTLSHELRTPLTNIRGYLEVCAEDTYGEISDAQRSVLDLVSRNCRRLEVLVGNFVSMNTASPTERQSADPLASPTEPDLVPLAIAAEDVARSLAAHAECHGVDVALELESCNPTVSGSALDIERLMGNLLDNAVKFSPAGSMVTMRLTCDQQWARLDVIDRGPGIAPRDQRHVFRPFFRGTRAVQGEFPGSGLGLPVAKTIVEKHNGSIDLESRPGQGTRVTVTLPLARCA
ncbi:GAF domain-containing sensor histidine kinase [Nocardioides sp.]|uniref:GAF domain-containing sensor histidine kinase n=1 Tax=Nocardioides sp. TaxID=35761 RepID=UPI002B275FC5|nr:GAF domain-containing sensor histidine kinase [Nocardioides sp.]